MRELAALHNYRAHHRQHLHCDLLQVRTSREETRTTKNRKRTKRNEMAFTDLRAQLRCGGATKSRSTNYSNKYRPDPGEAALDSSQFTLYETRADRRYQAGHAGVRVMSGVWVGGSSGQSTSTQEWALIDTGMLTITTNG